MLILIGRLLKSGILIDVECEPLPTPNPIPYLIATKSSSTCLLCLRSLISVHPLDLVRILKGQVIIVFRYSDLLLPFPFIKLFVFEISPTGAILTYPMLTHTM